MPGGCPRTHDREQIAKELIEWAKLDDSINLCGFSSMKMITATTIMKWAREDEQFGQAYELAKQYLGNRREKMLSDGKLHVKAYDLNANTYDPYLKAERREEKEFDAQLGTDAEKKDLTEISSKIDDMSAQLKAARAAKQD